MKTVEKYTTFEQLKAAEKAASDTKASLKKHASFEMLVNKIYIAKTGKSMASKAATLNGK
ncbi:hypothetical protein [Niabella soli]|uniref:Uncharacterized protein n=1 Tax=Niabella soli DSM 19437 TaxID=929713 RepID=W0F7L3_9BACT|nr:hypothetical protein [Niabella soli]AHF17341.1 hypothetical protein NIASO_05880 [Niabella soli DSM 19437]